MSTALSQYERTALQEINDWKSPEEQTWFGAIANAVSYPFDLAGDAVMSIPGAQTAVEKTVGGLISLLNDAAQWSIPANSAVEYYKGKKRSVNNRKDIFKLDLEEIDEAISYTGAKYRALAAAEGAGTGAVGVIGIPVDIVALVAMNLRAIGEYGTYCGFDMSKEHERLFAMRILGVSSSPTDAAKQVALAQLTKIGKEGVHSKKGGHATS